MEDEGVEAFVKALKGIELPILKGIELPILKDIELPILIGI